MPGEGLRHERQRKTQPRQLRARRFSSVGAVNRWRTKTGYSPREPRPDHWRVNACEAAKKASSRASLRARGSAWDSGAARTGRRGGRARGAAVGGQAAGEGAAKVGRARLGGRGRSGVWGTELAGEIRSPATACCEICCAPLAQRTSARARTGGIENALAAESLYMQAYDPWPALALLPPIWTTQAETANWRPLPGETSRNL